MSSEGNLSAYHAGLLGELEQGRPRVSAIGELAGVPFVPLPAPAGKPELRKAFPGFRWGN